ncbi:MAG: hypothetical protein U9N07_00860, partial [Euryarchaeota archaeon]|nr:hypothetical protein [Euryarchaeota archaeon]
MPRRTTSTGRRGGICAERESTPPPDDGDGKAPVGRTTLRCGSPPAPLLFFAFANHKTSNSTETDEKPCPLTVSGWIASNTVSLW